MSESKVSVIIPVYNVERYIEKCVNSVRAQTYKNIEIILVNDGSTDKSHEICKQLASQDNRIKLFHQENKGVSVARNKGIKEATGEWICFVDSDDEIEEDYLEAFHISDQDDVELYAQGYQIISDDKNKIIMPPQQVGEFSLDKAFDVLEDSNILNSPWVKLFRNSIIISNNISFNESLSYGEDHIFSVNYFKYVKKVIISDSFGYKYCRREGSLTTRTIDLRRLLLYMGLYAELYFDIFPLNSRKHHESYAKRQFVNLACLIRNSFSQKKEFLKSFEDRGKINKYLLYDGLNVKMRIVLAIYKLGTKIF